MIRAATLQLAVRNLLLHKLRSFLTMLGTILGVGSVISMLAIGEGSKREAVERIRQLGATNVIVRSVKPREGARGGQSDTQGTTATSTQQEQVRIHEYGLRYDDLELLEEALTTVDKAVPIALIRKTARRSRHRIPNARILGTTPEYLDVKKLTVDRGRFLTGPDIRYTTNVAVLGRGAADSLFGYEDPLEKTVLLGKGAYRVVGVLERQASGTATPGAVGQADFNEDIYIPLSAARNRFGDLQQVRGGQNREFERTELDEITLTVANEGLVSQTASMARRLLRQNHPEENDFEIQVPLELLHQAQREKRTWNIVLGSIAGISLVVGGIGIMNIMLATVTERTREIGIRRALGARRGDITGQFLVETMVLSATGGVFGVLLGLTLPLGVDALLETEAVPSWWAVALAFGMSVGVGIIFGLYPARRAALMDPIEALRHE